jgi:hypothetical protein
MVYCNTCGRGMSQLMVYYNTCGRGRCISTTFSLQVRVTFDDCLLVTVINKSVSADSLML